MVAAGEKAVGRPRHFTMCGSPRRRRIDRDLEREFPTFPFRIFLARQCMNSFASRAGLDRAGLLGPTREVKGCSGAALVDLV